MIVLLFAIVNLLRHPASVGIRAQKLSCLGTRDGGNKNASFGVVHERKEKRDERLKVRSQHVEEQFFARSRRLIEQIRALSDQLDAMDVANGRAVNQLHVSWMRMMWLPLVRHDLNRGRYSLTHGVPGGPP